LAITQKDSGKGWRRLLLLESVAMSPQGASVSQIKWNVRRRQYEIVGLKNRGGTP